MSNITIEQMHQYIDSFNKLLNTNIRSMVESTKNTYSQFPKEDANKLCTRMYWTFFIANELLVPWNIIICDEEAICDDSHYVLDTNIIEVILLYKISATERIQVTIDIEGEDALIEYKQLINDTWETEGNGYACVNGIPSLRAQHKAICEAAEIAKQNLYKPPSCLHKDVLQWNDEYWNTY